jgi:RNA polymerase sigma factor for flagellar operon FliA
MDNYQLIKHLEQWQQSGCIKSRNEAILGCRNILYNIGYKYKRGDNLDDLIQEGVLAIIDACNTFNKEQSSSFVLYVHMLIKYRMLEWLRKDTSLPTGSNSGGKHNLSHLPIPETHKEIVALAKNYCLSYTAALKYALCKQPEIECIVPRSPEELVEQQENIERLKQHTALLRPKQQQILHMYYNDDLTTVEIGAILKCSKQRVHQILQDGHKRLKERIL